MAKEIAKKKAAPKGTATFKGGKPIPDKLWENDPGPPRPLSERDQAANNAIVERIKRGR